MPPSITSRDDVQLSAQSTDAAHAFIVYIGTYTEKASKGIYAAHFDATSGRLSGPTPVAETTNPSFLALDPKRPFLYAVNEVSDYKGQKSGAVSSFAADSKTGKVTFLNQVSSRGAGPCHLGLDKSGRFLLVANYNAGNLVVFPVYRDGRLGDALQVVQHSGRGPDPKRQDGPHAHQIELSSDNRYALAADLGLDELLVYKFDPIKGKLTPNDVPFAKVERGEGPRHFAFRPDGKFVYLVTELRSTVDAFTYNSGDGTLKHFQTISALPGDFEKPNDAAEIAVHPSGKFLYVSNRGQDSITVFSIDCEKGTLSLVEIVATQGKTPRNFAIDPSGHYLLAANQESNNIVVFSIDERSGRLTPTGQTVDVPSPVCIVFGLE